MINHGWDLVKISKDGN